jgi:predicted subunit of tRNA(5-methylaminomethyl-2-thiouridylate) methyltransferase
MNAAVLFSGGKDSALAAILLSRDYNVELISFLFHSGQEAKEVTAAAEALGFPYRTRKFEPDILSRAADMVIACGFPNDAINMVHLCAVTALAKEYQVVADGTRFNDRVPKLPRPEVQRLWNRYGCSYVRPLLGYPKAEVDRLVRKFLVVSRGETGSIGNGDYEREIRAEVRAKGYDTGKFFPGHHEQSLVIRRR